MAEANKEILVLLHSLNTKVDMLWQEVYAMKQYNAARAAGESVESLRQEVVDYVLAYCKEHARPVNTGVITRKFSHRLRSRGLSVFQLLESVGSLHKASTVGGAMLYMPVEMWEGASETVRTNWLTFKQSDYDKLDADVRRMHEEFRLREEEIERRAAEFRRLNPHLTGKEPSDK